MLVAKISSDMEIDHIIVIDSDDMQDYMFCIERFAQERWTPKITKERERLQETLQFTVYGDCEFKGYGSNSVVNFKATIVRTFRQYISENCELLK